MMADEDPQPHRVHLSHSGAAGTHWAWLDGDGRLLVEWYDHGPDALYESANLLRFEPADAAALLGPDAPAGSTLAALQRLYPSWWAVRQAAVERGIAFTTEVDFLP